MTKEMQEMKNINTESDFQERTGLIIGISNKRNVKRLMKFGLLHYVSSKMNYALLYVDSKNLEQTIGRIRKENYVSSIEVSQLKDLPIEYEGVLDQLTKEINDQREGKGKDIYSDSFGLNLKEK